MRAQSLIICNKCKRIIMALVRMEDVTEQTWTKQNARINHSMYEWSQAMSKHREAHWGKKRKQYTYVCLKNT